MTNSTEPTIEEILEILDQFYGTQYGDVVRRNLKPSKRKKIGTVTYTKPKGWDDSWNNVQHPGASFSAVLTTGNAYYRLADRVVADNRPWLKKLLDAPEGSSVTREFRTDSERWAVEYLAGLLRIKVGRVKF